MLTNQEMLKYLSEIDQKLGERNQHGEIIMAGGAVLSLVYNARSSTKDIDALFQPSKELREIINEIAAENNLPDDWLNDGVKGFFTNKLQVDLFKEYNNLTVYSINAEGMLALKLTSARFDSHDADDCIVLMNHIGIQSENELFDIIEKYTDKNQQTINCYYFTKEVFKLYQNQIDKNNDAITQDFTEPPKVR